MILSQKTNRSKDRSARRHARGPRVSLRGVRVLEAVSASERRGRVGAAPERGGERGRAFGRRAGVEVPAGGRELRVAHGVLDAHEVDPAGDEQRSEGVAEVMPAERAQSGGVAGALVAAAQRGAVQRPAQGVAEDVVVRGDEILALGAPPNGVRWLSEP